MLDDGERPEADNALADALAVDHALHEHGPADVVELVREWYTQMNAGDIAARSDERLMSEQLDGLARASDRCAPHDRQIRDRRIVEAKRTIT